ncbi:MAG: hypothetical protein CBB79_10990 [Synechococcus sp. TMED19]|nr:MAG: hypothetical protein CBB79_10990 [Synechococcus sp. TMED19]
MGSFVAFTLPTSDGSPSEEQLRTMSGLDLLRTLECCHGELAWSRPEVNEFAATTLVVELPQALLTLLQQVIARTPLGENPPT